MSTMAGPSGEEKTYCYSDASSGRRNHNIHFHLVNQLQNFEPNPEIYNLTAGMEMPGFPSKNLNTDENTVLWKGFFDKTGGSGDGGGPSTSKEMNAPASSDRFYQNDLNKQHDLTGISDTRSENLMVSTAWSHHHLHHYQNRLLVDDPSLRRVFPCEGNERPSQGLSLSLNPSNYPSGAGLQPFELEPQDDLRFGPRSSRPVNVPQHSQVMQGYSHIRDSKYLGPAQDLLNEFCNLGTKQTDNTSKLKLQKTSDQDEDGVRKQSIYSLDLLELQIRKSKLFQMLEEVDRRYKYYCDQMKAVVSSFETVAGIGAATAYTALASKAMSRHFRCLRDGIVRQIKATKKAMEEKDTAAPGTVKGQTPRLKILDQTLRQQRALQQMSMMESHPWRPQRGLPERSVSILRAWLFEHFLHPYPSDVDKYILARQTGLSRSQVSNWFINARVRLWKPMVEEIHSAELRESEGMRETSLDGNPEGNEQGLPNQNTSRNNNDQKPTHDQLVRMDSGCLSSIINNPEKDDGEKSKTLQNEHRQNPSRGTAGDSYGAMQLDFSSYGQHSAGRGGATVSYVNELAGTHNHRGGVSLTLGLHQHGASDGVSLEFSPQSQSSLFYPREQMEDCQTVQYSLLDGESQNLPYRNLMGAQLLHDLAG